MDRVLRTAIQKLPDRVRTPLLTTLYGVAAGGVAVAFMMLINLCFRWLWGHLAALPGFLFALGSLALVTGASLVSGLLLRFGDAEAVGSGIPQLKVAYWKDLGVLRMRPVVVKFLAGILYIAGGNSLGREGPTVYVASGVASRIAQWLGVARQKRRPAAAAGAAAGLAAAFNTPLAAIMFVLEEVIGDLNSRLLGSVVLASVIGAFAVHALVGRQPAFEMTAAENVSWSVYAVVPLAAALAALGGVLFQRGALVLRARMRASPIPSWLSPVLGGWVTWLLGAAVFMNTGRLGIFGLGYQDLSESLTQGMGWRVAGVLLLAKLVASTVSYGTGGCGGIFSPTLFIGGMSGFLVAGLAGPWIHLGHDDVLLLAAVGMSSCLGAMVRVPLTAVLITFEMTHQFSMVPALMIGVLISQFVARLAGKRNFYDSLLMQDGHELQKIIPPRDLTSWQSIQVSAIANMRPVVLRDLSEASCRATLARYPYRSFPVELSDGKRGAVTRRELETALAAGRTPALEPLAICHPDQTLRDVERLMIDSTGQLVAVADQEGGPITGLITLHDLLRAQVAMVE